MAHVMRYKPAYGAAVYQVSDATAPDDAPLADPLGNLSRVKFHSGLIYPAIASVVSGTTTFGGYATNQDIIDTKTIYSHGLGAAPVVFGKITSINGVTRNLPFTGSVLIGTAPIKAFPIWLTLGASSSLVTLTLFTFTFRDNAAMSAQTIGWTIYVCDATVDGPNTAGDATKPMLELTADRITAGRRKFDTNRRYIRSGATTGAANTLVRGESAVVVGAAAASSADYTQTFQDTGFKVRYSVNGVTVETASTANSSSFAANTTTVQL